MTKMVATILIIFGAITLILGLFIGMKTFKPMYFNVVAGLIIAIGTIFGLFGKQLQDKSSSEKSDKILNTGISTSDKVSFLQGQNKTLSLKVDSQSETIDKLRQENTNRSNQLLNANEKIIELQNSSLNEITGGKNLPVISVGRSSNAYRPYDEKTSTHANYMIYKHDITFTLINAGKYSLKDIMFSIKDAYSKPELLNGITPYDYQKQVLNMNELGSYHNIEVKTLALQSRKAVYSTKLPESRGNGKYSFDVIIEWSDGLYQSHFDIVEKLGNITIEQKYFDSDGKEIDQKALESRINKNL